jgi:D-glycerate 3-kinase
MNPIEETVFDHAPIRLIAKKTDNSPGIIIKDCENIYPSGQKLNRLLILYPLDYRYSLQWRQAAETKGGMTPSEIEEFVKYFWKSLHPQLFLPPLLKQAELVVEINQDNQSGKNQLSVSSNQ